MATNDSSPVRRSGSRAAVGSTLVALFLFVLSGYMTFQALSFPFRPRLAPLTFSGLTFLLAIAVLVAEARDYLQRKRPPTQTELRQEDEATTDTETRLGAADEFMSKSELLAFGWVAVLIASFFLFGFVVGMSLFMVVMMRIYGRETWRLSLTVTAGVMAVLYVMFVRVLDVRVYPGLLGDLLPLPF